VQYQRSHKNESAEVYSAQIQIYSLQFEIDFGRQFVSFRCEKVKQQDGVKCEPVKLLKKKIVEAYSSQMACIVFQNECLLSIEVKVQISLL
jgi:hypothetical protein